MESLHQQNKQATIAVCMHKQNRVTNKIYVRNSETASHLCPYLSPYFLGITICGVECVLTARWESTHKVQVRCGYIHGKPVTGSVVVTTISGGKGTSTVSFRLYNVNIGGFLCFFVWLVSRAMPCGYIYISIESR